MRIGIVTLYGNFNYGNRLQNYALQEILKKLGHEPKTLIMKNRKNQLKEILKIFLEKENSKLRIRKVKDIKREKNFDKFNKKNIDRYILNSLDGKFTEELNKKYDYFIVGSDQVWNPNFWREKKEGKECNNYLLKFVEPSKRISYAASFGVDNLDKYWEEEFKEELKYFKAISVREEEGKKIVNRLSIENVEVVLDPTMLLTKEEWLKLEEKVNNLSSKYILVFFLGNIDMETNIYIENIAKKRNLEIINMMSIDDRNVYSINPAQLIYMIRNAELVITDSFHLTVFSIIFQKYFLSLKRKQKGMKDMSSRLTTLLKKVKLEKRMEFLEENEIFKCNFEEIEKILENEREKSIFFLKKALED